MVDGKAWGTVIENSTKEKENTEDLNKNIIQFNNASAGPGLDRIFDLIRLTWGVVAVGYIKRNLTEK